jgi:hypothetical protein
MNTPDANYMLSMFSVHLALFTCLACLKSELSLFSGWRVVVQFACVSAIGYALFRVYEVIPALWWPGAREQFNYWRAWCLAPVPVSVLLRSGAFGSMFEARTPPA